MTKIATVSAAVVLGLAAAQASAQMIYEPFEYGSSAPGTPLAGLEGPPVNGGYTNAMNGQRWFGTDAPTSGTPGYQPTINAGSLPTLAGLPAAVGDSLISSNNYLTPAPGSVSPRLGMFPGVTSGMLYYSLAFRVTDITNLTTGTGGSFFAGFNNLTGTQTAVPSTVFGRINLYRENSTSTRYFIGIRDNGTDVTYSPAPFQADDGTTVGDTVFVVVGVDPTANAQVSKMWINPDPSLLGQAVAPDTSLVVNGGNNLSGGTALNSFTFRFSNNVLAKGIAVDEIRVDRTWAQVAPAAGSTWTGAPGGAWSDGSNWSTAAAPDGTGAFANFVGGAGGAVALASARTVGTLNLKGPAGYTLSGAPLTLDGSTLNPATSAVDAGPAAINVYAPVDATTGAPVATTHTIASDVTLAQDLSAHVAQSQTLALTGDLSAAGRAVVKTGPGTLQVKNLRASSLAVQGGTVAVATNGTATGTSVLSSFSVTGTTSGGVVTYFGALDLRDNDLVVDDTDSSSFNSVKIYVKAGYAAGAWTGNGITSSSAAANGHTGLALAEASDLLGSSGGTFSDQSVDGTAVLVKYTWYGDLNFDGRVNGDDYTLHDRFVAANPTATNARWMDGDFNYDGVVDTADLLLMDAAFGAQSGGLSPDFLAQREAQYGAAYVADLVAAVPEPTSAGLLGLAASALLARRRRQAVPI